MIGYHGTLESNRDIKELLNDMKINEIQKENLSFNSQKGEESVMGCHSGISSRM